ncbi:hypothetical protein Scep_016333 [Stephania cephalantha]|uniref:Uncharacterized protein n=1 Tax=Stephania cephalantha TaxID=152367 RepID=A0AAP0NUJ0_9MAGN
MESPNQHAVQGLRLTLFLISQLQHQIFLLFLRCIVWLAIVFHDETRKAKTTISKLRNEQTHTDSLQGDEITKLSIRRGKTPITNFL